MQPGSKLRANSTVDQWIRCSLQSCSNPDDCFILLTSIESQSRSECVKNKILGLSEVLKHLYMPEICNGNKFAENTHINVIGYLSSLVGMTLFPVIYCFL